MYFDFTLILTVLVLVTLLLSLIARFVLRPQLSKSLVYRVVVYIGSFFPVLLLVWFLRSFLYEPFRIPSGSMIPTLLVGDYIVVNKFAYGVRWPVINKKFIDTSLPERGDVVVFRYPKDERLNYIKRLIGLPGDRITYRNKHYFINGEEMPQEPKGFYLGVGGERNAFGAHREQLEENLDGVLHSILLNPQNGVAGEQSWVVPEGHYFMSGDNRDNSEDSRRWGFVPEANLVGRAERVWWHCDWSNGCFNFSRIGEKIE